MYNHCLKKLLNKRKNRPISFNSSLRQKFAHSVNSILTSNRIRYNSPSSEFIKNSPVSTPNNSFSLDFSTIAGLNMDKVSFVEPKNMDFNYAPSSTADVGNFFKSENSGSTIKHRPVSINLPVTHKTVINSMW